MSAAVAVVPGSVADRRLRSDLYAWLTTVGGDMQPHSSLVLFYWNGSDVLVYTIPDRRKVGNIESHSKVSVNLNAEPDGGGVVTLAGTARLRYGADTALGYLDKYSELLAGFGLSPEEFERQYSIEVRITPIRVRAW